MKWEYDRDIMGIESAKWRGEMSAVPVWVIRGLIFEMRAPAMFLKQSNTGFREHEWWQYVYLYHIYIYI